ncbi:MULTISPECIES: PAAR domain-containing protein [Stenotrophomonas maltophilia group]|nr:PAAR domain-containing protein [Stenotrophomonas maltophilia]MDZ5816362.1 PAAR domain-containing protein [Stenotrophomonas maltophilia]
MPTRRRMFCRRQRNPHRVMKRHWIVVGDSTRSNGRVITGSPHTDIEGKAVAREGDRATCPLHQGIFPIVQGDPTLLIDGHPVALHGHHLACGCPLISTQQRLVYVTDATFRDEPSTPAPIQLSALKPAVCLECLRAAASSAAPLLVRA